MLNKVVDFEYKWSDISGYERRIAHIWRLFSRDIDWGSVMRSWSFRVVTFLFMLSMLATPLAVVNAQNVPAATPIEEVPTPTEPVDDPNSQDGEGVSTPDESDAEVSTPAPGNASRPGLEINAELPDEAWNFLGTSAYWDNALNQGRLGIGIFEGSDIRAGDTIRIWYPPTSLTISNVQITALGAEPTLPVTVDVSSEFITLTFTADFNPDVPAAYEILIDGIVTFPECGPSQDGSVQQIQIMFQGDGNKYTTMVAEGDPCDASQVPAVSSIGFLPLIYSIQIGIDVPDASAASGAVITIEYPSDRLVVEPSSGILFAQSSANNFVAEPVGTVVVANGIITITFDEDPDADALQGGEAFVVINADFNTEACDPQGGNYVLESDPIHFLANPGGAFYSGVEDVLCNAVSPTMTGVISADGSTITWTLDTGELINGGHIQNGIIFGDEMTADCDSIQVVPVTGEFAVDTYCAGADSAGFSVYLNGEGAVRAQITSVTTVSGAPQTGSYLYCATVIGSANIGATQTLAREGNGYGGLICAEAFPPGGGDFVTNTVSAATAFPGDTLTYTVHVETTSVIWTQIELTDVLPQGFEVTSVNCSATPVELASDSCEILDNGSIIFGAYLTDLENAELKPGSITLEFQGVVTALPGTQLENAACYERRLDLGLAANIVGFFDIGSGVICASAFTQVVAPPTTPTETPTVTPATPTETVVSATPTETPVSKQTSVRVEMWDGSGIEGAAWELYAPVASQVMTNPYLTGVLDANNSALFTDIPAGDYRFVVSPEGLGQQEFTITVSDQSEEIVVQFAQPATPATPGATPEAPADPTQTAGTNPVTGLPSTGTAASGQGATTLIVTTLAAAMLMMMALGVRIRSSEK